MAKRALLVGIDVYPDPRNNLNSCVADTRAFKKLLEDYLDFESESIRMLHNQDATLSNVKSSLDALFDGVTADDRVVFYQSSHGYRYPEGDTMVEVLCEYDGFLKDTELAERSATLPPGVLTVVLDACHSGGMNKMFFPNPEKVEVARAKVWQPPAERAERDANLYTQVSKFKFFGRSSASTSGAVAKNFMLDPVDVPMFKGMDQSTVDLNGVLFSACMADQTAAAGSPPTNNLSAFTYGIVQEITPTIALNDLNTRIGTRLQKLNMSQTPMAVPPPLQPELATSTFVSLHHPDGGAAGLDKTVLFEPPGLQSWIRGLLASRA